MRVSTATAAQVMLGLTLLSACLVPTTEAGVLTDIIETFNLIASGGDVSSTNIPGTKLYTANNFGWYSSNYWYGMGIDMGFSADVSGGYEAPMYNAD